MAIHAEMLIDGHLIGGPCDQSVGKVVARNPFNGAVVGTAAEGDESSLRTAIAAAHDAFSSWRQTTGASRAVILRKVAATVRGRRSELADLLVAEIGKPIVLAEAEVDRLAVTFDLAANAAEALTLRPIDLAGDSRAPDYVCRSEQVPLGVVLAIVPYNWPYNLTAHKIAPALAAGNTVVVKPSPMALLSTYALGRLLHDCGVPPGVVNVVDAPVTAVQKLVRDERVAMVSFTGSAAVGWPLKSSLRPETRCVLELGGDASAIVSADADIEWAIERIALGGFAYAGQICISTQHVLVDDRIYADFVNAMVAHVATVPTGDPRLRDTVCGPLISGKAADKVQGVVEEAVAGGARILTGGERSGAVIQPCLVSDVPPQSALARTEIFGPVLTIAPYSQLVEAIQTVNRSHFAIQTSIFTQSADEANQCFAEIESGAVILNDHTAVRFDVYPYGGVRESGFGREGVAASMAEMSQPRVRLDRKTR